MKECLLTFLFTSIWHCSFIIFVFANYERHHKDNLTEFFVNFLKTGFAIEMRSLPQSDGFNCERRRNLQVLVSISPGKSPEPLFQDHLKKL